MTQIKKHLLDWSYTAAILPAAAIVCLLAGCDAAVSHPEGSGFPTISAASVQVEGDPPTARLVLGGARDILPTDTNKEMDLSVYRNKTILVVYSKRRAISLASVADIQLSVGAGPDGMPFALEPGEYDLVSVSDDGETSYRDTVPIATIIISK